MTRRVVILQEYVPQYRVPFFDRLVELAAKNGVEVVIVAGRPNSSLARRGDDAEPPYLRRITQRELKIGSKRVVVRDMREAIEGADLVIMEQARRNLDAYWLFLPRILRKSRWALWGHGRDYVESKSRFSTWLQASLTLRSDWFFAYTPGGAAYVESLGFKADRITTVMNSLDTQSIEQGVRGVTTEASSEFKSRHSLRNKVVTFIGALDESKRIPFLLESIQKLEGNHPDVSFVMAGDGPLRDQVVRMTNLRPNVHAIGRVDGSDKDTLLALTDLLLIPGRVGLVAVDALASGIPIITTNWKYHAPEFEYLEDGVTCRVSDNNPSAYAAAVDELLLDKDARERLSANCMTVGKQLGVAAMAENFFHGISSALV